MFRPSVEGEVVVVKGMGGKTPIVLHHVLGRHVLSRHVLLLYVGPDKREGFRPALKTLPRRIRRHMSSVFYVIPGFHGIPGL